MYICACLNCGNSTYNIERWKQTICLKHSVLHETNGCDCERPFKLFSFPVEKLDPDGRKRWTKQVNRKVETKRGKHVKNWEPAKYSRICSKHFVDGQPTITNPDPTLHLGYETKTVTAVKRAAPKEREALPPPAKKVRISPNIDHTEYFYKCDCQLNCKCPGCLSKHTANLALQAEIDFLRKQLKQVQSKKSATVNQKTIFLKSRKKVRVYTSLPNREAFFGLLEYLSPVAKKMTYWLGSKKVVTKARLFKKSPRKGGPLRKLKLSDELLLVLMKLRLGVSNQLLADIFCISICTCSRVFNTWIKMMAKELKPLVFWPDKGLVLNHMPPQMVKQFPHLRCTIDCTEIFIDRPRHLELQAQTWSDYKKHNTVKLLIAIAPNGMISFLSRAFGGRASDRYITRTSGFLNLIDPKDVILADRGFPIQEDLLLRHATLFIPPPSSGLEQQTKQDVLKTKKVANARIHVERAIGRLKNFKLLKNTLPISLIPLINEIVLVCSALCNLQPPLVY